MKIKSIAVSVMLGMGSLSSYAQWSTQQIELKGGWNAVYLHIDASHATIEELELDENINQIWLWKPQVNDAQFIKDPDKPDRGKSRWIGWVKDSADESDLKKLIGNTAYLVQYGSEDVDGNWVIGSGILAGSIFPKIKGHPVPPSYNWTSSGLNLIGFSSHPTTATTIAPFLENYFPEGFMSDLEFFSYNGGKLTETNPRLIVSPRKIPLQRGKAFWVKSKSGQFINYFAPYDLVLQNHTGVEFGETGGQYRVIIKNRSDNGLVVTLKLNASEDAPKGQQDYGDDIKLMIATRELMVGGATLGGMGTLNYNTQSLKNDQEGFTIYLTAAGQPGASKEVILGLDRSELTGLSGSRHGSVLEFTDSLGHSQVKIPVRAIKGSNVGLWVGDAKVKEVRHNITVYKTDDDSDEITLDYEGEPVIDSINQTYGTVPNSFPLRLIFHQGTNTVGTMKMYQSVFHGLQKGAETQKSTELILSSDEDSLHPGELKFARRITALHLPLFNPDFDFGNKNGMWVCEGEIKAGQTAKVSVTVAHDNHASNPFLHTYHPDHDNINDDLPKFKEHIVGKESFTIRREIQLEFENSPTDFEGITRTQRRISGNYYETMSIIGADSETIEYNTKGSFLLNRISTIDKVISSN